MMPRASARVLAWRLDVTPSLAKISATWRSTVRTESTSWVAISLLVMPAASNRSTSSCLSVRPAGFSRVPAIGPRGTFGTPSSRSLALTWRASGVAPSESRIDRASSSAPGSELSARAAA